MPKKYSLQKKLKPLALSLIVVLLDQISKLLIEQTIPLGTVGASFGGDFLRIIHVTNMGAAFSMGNSLSEAFRTILLCWVPLIILLIVTVLCIATDEFTSFQRWSFASVIGGGIGNLIDRFFRPLGVVDFIDVKFYGIFGLERWPTFNIADMAVLIGAIVLALSFLRTMRKNS